MNRPVFYAQLFLIVAGSLMILNAALGLLGLPNFDSLIHVSS